MQRHNGNSITEYAIIGAVVMIALIAVVGKLGNGLDDRMADLHDNMTDSVSSAQEAEATRTQADPTAGAKGVKSKVVCLSNGVCIKVPDPSGADNKVVVTAGANGSDLTKAYARSLKAMLKKLQADPNTDPGLLALMKKLVNGGYDLARAEADSLKWCAKKTCVSGKADSKKVQEAADKGLDKTDAVYFAYSSYDDGMGGGVANEMKQYLKDHPGALPPDGVQLVNNMSDNITTIAKAFNPVDNFGSREKGTKVEAGQDVKDTTKLKDAPEGTKASANTQCGTVSGCTTPNG